MFQHCFQVPHPIHPIDFEQINSFICETWRNIKQKYSLRKNNKMSICVSLPRSRNEHYNYPRSSYIYFLMYPFSRQSQSILHVNHSHHSLPSSAVPPSIHVFLINMWFSLEKWNSSITFLCRLVRVD